MSFVKLCKKSLKTPQMLYTLVSITKGLIQRLREDGWHNLLKNVISFSKKFEIDITNLIACYIKGQGCDQHDYI